MTLSNANQVQSNTEETYYDLLRISPSATISEIVNAYHAAKSAYSKDSIAIYSLFDSNDTQSILAKLEEAYMTLSNMEKRRNYDRHLSQTMQTHNIEENKPMSNSSFGSNSPDTNPFEVTESKITAAAVPQPLNPLTPPVAFSATPEMPGSLISLRVARGLTLEDVARITKIPAKFLTAIETFDVPHLPAKVYIQGFIKNLSQLYRIDAKEAVKVYLTELESRSTPKQN